MRAEDRDVREWDQIALRRRTGYVIQDVGLFPHLTVAGNIATVPSLLSSGSEDCDSASRVVVAGRSRTPSSAPRG